MSRIFDALKQAELANRSCARSGMASELSAQTAFLLHEPDSVQRLRSAVRVNEKLGRRHRVSRYLTWFLLGIFFISASVVFLRGGVSSRQAIESTTPSEAVLGPRSQDSTVGRSTAQSPEPLIEQPTELSIQQPTSPSPAVDSAELPGFVLQVAAMKHEENAYTLVESLQRRNLPVFVFRLGLGGFYRVAVGVYRDAAAAATAKRELETQGFKTILKPWRPDKALGETASRAIATGSPIARNSYIR